MSDAMWAVVGVGIFYGVVRNTCALIVAERLISADLSVWRRMPGHYEMTFHPRHLHRWTVKQWIKYVEANHG